jgi:transposase
MSRGKRRTFTPEFKLKIIRLKLSNTMTTREICDTYDLDRQTVHRWVKEYHEGGAARISGKGVVPGKDLEAQKKIKRLEMENEILKKAEAYFAKKKIK